MAAPNVDVVVIGAGVVGLASAAALASSGRSVLILEREAGIARGVSSRNSEVIHAGLYDPPESLKARLCTRGRTLLYERCEARGIGCQRLGKWVVASTPAECPALEALRTRASANHVPGLSMVSGQAVARAAPVLAVEAALFSSQSGIVDAQALALSFLAEAEAANAVLLLRHEVVELECVGGHWRVEVRSLEAVDAEWQAVECGAVVNAAGLSSDRIAQLAGLDIDACGYRIHPCKGDYFALAPGRSLRLPHLVYPLPGRAGLGVHATLDLAGQIRFGPDAHYVDVVDYRVDPAKAEAFGAAARRYIPSIRDDWLVPAHAGVRPKRAAPGETFRDFVVCEESVRGLPGLVDCIGIESPGLTASPAIGERVAALLVGL